jgi:hypothetical protein
MRRTQKLALPRQVAHLGVCLAGGARLAFRRWLLWMALAVTGTLSVVGAEPFHAGPLFDEFDLTLAPGHRTEAMGPLYYTEQQEAVHTWALPPFCSYLSDSETGFSKFDFLYPVFTYNRYGEQYRIQLGQVLSIAGGPTQTETARDRITIFPLYFQQRSTEPSENYTAVFPFYGHIKHRLFRDDWFFVMWPLYVQSKKKDVVTDNYLVPLFDVRHGDGLHGWQLWPLIGTEHRDIMTQTNGFGDIKTISGYDSSFALWPLYLHDRMDLGTPNPQWRLSSLPAFSLLRSPQRDSTTVIWPFFNVIDDREKKYHEVDAPWPLIEFAHGEGKTTTRIWPFYSKAHTPTLESDFYLWPIYKFNGVYSEPLDSRRTRIVFFLYSDLREKNTETKAVRRRIDCWPFFIFRRDFTGNGRLQIIAPLEPFVPMSKSVQREYSPLWSVWRSENNPRAHATSQSLLWNLYRHDKTPTTKKCSLLFGLFQYQSGPDGNRTRLFYMPLSRTKTSGEGGTQPAPATKTK